MKRDNPRKKRKMRQLVVRTFLFSGVIDKPIPHSVPKYNNPQTHRSISKSLINDSFLNKKNAIGLTKRWGMAVGG
jgi:hypothetical protein